MAAIGAVTATMVKYSPSENRQHVEVWNRPGADGNFGHRLGRHGAEFQVAAILYGTSAEVETWFGQIEAVQGAIVSIIDDWGVTHEKCLILHVGERRRQAARAPGSNLECIGELSILALRIKTD